MYLRFGVQFVVVVVLVCEKGFYGEIRVFLGLSLFFNERLRHPALLVISRDPQYSS